MSASRRRSWLTTRSRSTQRTRRRRFSPLSPGGLLDWMLEVRCLLSTAPSSLTSEFSVAHGQTEIINVSTTPVIDLKGNLDDQGTIYLVSTNPLEQSVTISAQNIIEGAGATITTVLPPGGLPGYSNAINNLSLTLDARHGVVISGAITTDGGAITIKAGGNFSDRALISSSGVEPGRDAGDIDIIGNAIIIDKPLLAIGSNGANGADATAPGTAGADGDPGGKGGMITVKATDGITINADIRADGGNGGNGGNGSDGSTLLGGAGGGGGDGGRAGTVTLTTKNAAIHQAAGFVITAWGGSGGNGGAGGKGAAAIDARAGNGGRGGDGGQATQGGSLRADSRAGNIKLSGTLNFNSGSGGGGGAGGDGGSGLLAGFAGGNGGSTGASQGGALGGMIDLQTKTGAISLASASANGGNGGQTAASGSGGDGTLGGAGGLVLDGGGGGQGGTLQFASKRGAITVTNSRLQS